MLNRRTLCKNIPLTALAISPAILNKLQAAEPSQGVEPSENNKSVLLGPPVVQNPTADGFSVCFRVSCLATGEVMWGDAPDNLVHHMQASIGGLVRADDEVLSVNIFTGSEDGLKGDEIYYQVIATPLLKRDESSLTLGQKVRGKIHQIKRHDRVYKKTTLVCVNDTHESTETINQLVQRTNELDPDFIAWNGDTCRSFNNNHTPAAILLGPGSKGNDSQSEGWASRRPLLFVPGNHDFRGSRANEVYRSMLPWAGSADLPHNFIVRRGPLVLIGLSSGEDKLDYRFNGLAAFEPQRRLQAQWLKKVLKSEEVKGALFKIALVHIPLRGLPGQNDGSTDTDYASWSGQGNKLWSPLLREAGVQMVVSGHTHTARIQDPDASDSLMQVVGGGPQLDKATLIYIEADERTLDLRIENLEGKVLMSRELKA